MSWPEFVSDSVIAYETRLRNVTITRAWGIFRGVARELVSRPDDAPLNFEFFQEVDRHALGYGGDCLRVRATLCCKPDYTPIEYSMSGTRSFLNVRFADGRFHAVMRGGAEVHGEALESDFLLASNCIPQLAIKIHLLYRDNNFPYRGTCFLPETLSEMPYELRRLGSRIESSLGEQFQVDGDGWIVGGHSLAGELTIHTLSDAPPERGWELARPVSERVKPGPSWRRPAVRYEYHRVQMYDGVETGATLSLPASGASLHACAVFLGGSGIHDRDGYTGEIDLGYHQTMDALAAAGILGLRYDKRGAGTTPLGGSPLEPSFEEELGDARRACKWLRSYPSCSTLPLVLLGHSQGGLMALAVAAGDRSIGGVVLLATAGRPLGELLEDQLRVHASMLQLRDEALKEELLRIRALFSAVRSTREWTPENVPPHVYAAKGMRRFLEEQLEYNPTALIRKLTCPVLILQGERDVQVFVKDALLLEGAARMASVRVDLEILPDCDHLLMPTSLEGGVREYFGENRVVSQEVTCTIRRWIASAVLRQ